MMNNAMQLMQLMRNPQAILQQAMQSGNPIVKNAIEMYQKGDTDVINKLAQNLCHEKGLNMQDIEKQIKSQFGF